MRRGQLLTLDAMLSLILVVFILATVTNTSSALKEEISSMIEWQERANIAENMLDVLTKSPGEPTDWQVNITHVIVPGLRSSKGTYIDYSKVTALIKGAKARNPTLQDALWNLSNRHDFKLAVSVPSQSVELIYNYTVSRVSEAGVLAICNVNQLGDHSDFPSLINASQCGDGEFDFTHDSVSFDSYYNPYYVCVQGNTNIGNNFKVTLGQYLAVNGSLNVGSAGWLSASAIYVTGDAYIGSSGYATDITDDSYIGGDFTVESNGNATFGKNLYVYGSTTVKSSGYLTVGGSLYSLGQLDVQSNGNVNVSRDLYVGNDATVGNSGNLWVGSDLFVNGNLNGQSSLDVHVSGTAFINGSLSLPSGTLMVGDALYVNGDFTQNPSTTVDVYGDTFINGDLSVEGTNTFHRDLHVNGDLTIDWGKTLIVYGDLYVSGKLIINGKLVVKGNIYEYSNNDPPIYLASDRTLQVGGWVYTYHGRTWYALKGGGTSQSNYSGYTEGILFDWSYRPVVIWNNHIEIVNRKLVPLVDVIYLEGGFHIQINGTGSLVLPPDKGEAFTFNPPSSLMPPAPEFQYPKCKASEESGVVIDVKSVNVTYKFSPEAAGWENISLVGGTFVGNPSTVKGSMKNSTWVQHSERSILVSCKVYNQSYTITEDRKILLYEGRFPWGAVGGIKVTIPDSNGNLTLVSAFSTEEYVGYTVMVVVKNGTELYYGLITVIPKFNYTGVPQDCRVQKEGNTIIIPTKCFVPLSSNTEKTVTFSLWVYHNTFPKVTIEDVGGIGTVIQPIYRMAFLKLWVWGE